MGKGNHSQNHVQKIKPRVEQVCQELGLQYSTEENEGRMYINLTGASAQMPPAPHYGGGYQQGGHQQYHGGQQHHGQQQQDQNGEVEEVVKKLLPRVYKALRGCCVVM